MAALAMAPHPAAAQAPVAGPSQQDKETARTLFDKGVEAEQRGQLDQATAYFRDANKLVHVPSTALFLARVLAKKGLLIEARAASLEAAQAPVQQNEAKFQTQCRGEAAILSQELEGRIPSLLLRIEGAPRDQVALEIDQQKIPPLESNPARKLNPGAHTVTITAPGFLPVTERVMLVEREAKDLRVTMVRGVAGSAPPKRSAARTSEPDVSPIVLMGLGFGLGGASLMAGAVTGALSLARTSDLDEVCGGSPCPPTQADEWQEAKTLATVADVTLIAGGVLAAAGFGGLIWLTTTSNDRVGLQLELAPRAVSVTVRF